MKIYEYTSQKNTKRATGLIMIFAAAGAGLFLIPALIPNIPLGWMSQLLGVAALTAMIFVISRCIARTFVYALIENGDRTIDLTVTELGNGGKKQTTVCRVSLGNITEAYLLYPERSSDARKLKELEARARREQRKRYSYCYESAPTPTCLLFLEECGEPLFIKLAPDEQLFEYVKRFSQKKENE